MSKIIKALQTIKDCCEGNEWCDMCPLGYRDEYYNTSCRLNMWGDKEIEPCDWPIDEVVKHEK